MLHMILGTAGTGKTTALYTAIEAHVKQGKQAILLVPEQASFEAEKALYRLLGAKLASSVQVLSFTRLCNSIFRAYGGLSMNYISDTGKLLLMSIALSELKDTLHFYSRHLGNSAFTQSLIGAVAEFKTCGITPEALSTVAEDTEEGRLKEKTRELSLIYSTYNALLETSYSDSDDDITTACKKLEGQHFFGEYGVFIDSFMAFTACEYRMLDEVIAQSEELYVTFCCDGLSDDQGGLGVFSASKAAAGRLLRLAKKNGVAVAAPMVLTEQRRFQSPILAHIEAGFLRGRVERCHDDTTGAEVVSARNPYDEVAYVASEISRLVAEEGYRYRDIAVIARSLDRYELPIERLFERYDIAYFLDRTEDINTKPLVTLILSAIEAVRMNFDTEQILKFAKNPLLNLDITNLALLENYAYVWGVQHILWTLPFENNPSGMVDTFTAKDKEILETVNRLREQIMEPLLELKSALKDMDGKGFAKGIFALLTQLNIAENITLYAETIKDSAQRKAFLEEEALLWDSLVDILEIFAEILGNIRVSLPRAAELFRLALGSIQLGKIPQTLDQVIIGTADRIRPNEPKATFVIGAIDTEFPASIQSHGVFTDAERTALAGAGLELSDNLEQKSVYEKFFAYFAITTASAQLTVTYPRLDLNGTALAPSVIAVQVSAMVGEAKSMEKLRKSILMRNKKTAIDLFSAVYGEDSTLRASLREYLWSTSYQSLLVQMDNLAVKQEHKITDRAVAKSLFGTDMKLSPSRVERFYNCPFAYFCDSGLKLKPRKKVEFSPIESGKAIHLVLEYMVKKYGGKGLQALSSKEIRREITEVLKDYLRERTENITALPARFQYLFTRLVNTLEKLIVQLAKELAQCDFEPYAFEMPIKTGEQVEPVRLQTEGDVTIRVEGIVDRVDVMKKNGITYVRVIDYKSGSKTFKLSDIYYGLNMQMLLYLFSIAQNGSGELLGAKPAGVLYMPAKNVIISANRGITDDELAAEHQKKLKMNGLILGDKEVVLGMEQDGQGIYIPAKLKDNETFDVRSSIVSAGEMGVLKAKIEKNILDMANTLLEGGIGAVPVQSSAYAPCSYCDYKGVCGFEDGDKVKTITDVNLKEMLSEEEGEA